MPRQPSASPCSGRLPFLHGLSFRLLLLTVVFVMVAEAAIFAPSVGRFRLMWLQERLGAAHLALLALEATPDGMVDMDLQRRLLAHAGTLGMTAWRADRGRLMLGPDMPPDIDQPFDIREHMFMPLLWDGLRALVRPDNRIISVLGPSPKDPATLVEAVLYEGPMIADMRAYGWRILALSLGISLFAACLVYVSLHWLLVRPLRRLSQNMAAFRDAPEDATRVLVPSRRRDEVGLAEHALAEMQNRLRHALAQQARLAAVGTAVSKISHDLKGILTTAMLESDRLRAAAGDCELEQVTDGIARALDRAVGLTTSTLRYATEGPPSPRLQAVTLAPLLAEAAKAAGPGMGCVLAVPATAGVRADPDLLLRILENLARNAAEAGAKALTFRTAAADRGRMRVLIADDGPGLPRRARDNLFIPFSGSARPGGTGLGLPIARDLARAMGGELTLAGSSRDGTTFSLDLPAA